MPPFAEMQAERAGRMLAELSEESLDSAMDYIAWLRHREAEEDQKDIACYLDRRDEPEISLEALTQKLGRA